MTQTLDTVLLLALPASGKSEVRKYLAQLTPEECRRDFHLGETVQLDDFPYVHFMRCVDDALVVFKKGRMFFHSPDRPFQNPLDWGTLIHLLNEDYDDLLSKNRSEPKSKASWLFERIDRAAQKCGGPARFEKIEEPVRLALADRLEREALHIFEQKMAGIPDSLEGKTVVVEFARGGAQGSSFPLPFPFGYQYSLGQLSKALLRKATILYVWVNPEESRRKNDERSDPNDPGSILNHGVPIEVMLKDYGCDDMTWLEENSKNPQTVTVLSRGQSYELPVARFDNRQDKTTFVRKSTEQWLPEERNALHQGLQQALERLFVQYRAQSRSRYVTPEIRPSIC